MCGAGSDQYVSDVPADALVAVGLLAASVLSFLLGLLSDLKGRLDPW